MSPVLLEGVFISLLQNLIWSLNQTGVLHVTENGFRCSYSVYDSHITNIEIPLYKSDSGSCRWDRDGSTRTHGIASRQRMHQLSTTDRLRSQFVENDLWICGSVARHRAARMSGVMCVLAWLLPASSWLWQWLWHPSVRLATWFWPSYNGWHYSNSCCRQHVTSAAFVWNVHSRDQYGGSIYNSIAGGGRFHLHASRLQLHQYSPTLAHSDVCLQ